MGNGDDQGGEKNIDMAEDMDAYYQAREKSKSGSALLYGLFALVVTLIVAAGLYFGGRAVYRALTGTSEETGQQQGTQETNNTPENTQDAEDSSGQTQTPGVSSDTPSGTSDEENDGSEEDSSSESMPSTGDNLPSTGSPTGM